MHLDSIRDLKKISIILVDIVNSPPTNEIKQVCENSQIVLYKFNDFFKKSTRPQNGGRIRSV